MLINLNELIMFYLYNKNHNYKIRKKSKKLNNITKNN